MSPTTSLGDDVTASLLEEASLLDYIDVPGIGTLKPEGLTILVGPNSSGKTLFLKDIQQRVTGGAEDLIVLNRVRLRKPDSLERFLEVLTLLEVIEDRKANTRPDDPVLRAMIPYLGRGSEGSFDMHLSQIAKQFGDFAPHDGRPAHHSQSRVFPSYFGKVLTTSLFLDNRLQFKFEEAHFDYQSSRPTNEVQYLYYNREYGDALTTEIQAAFGKAVWIDGTRGSGICVRVSDEAATPSERDRRDPRTMRLHRLIQVEGDGLKSYCAICLALLPSRRPLCLIDEPELCLHPPQAYRIGRFIGTHAARSNRGTFVSTHSSHVLRGILDTAPDARVIRMTRSLGQFKGTLISSEKIRESLSAARATSPGILDAIFADGAILVEGDSDRVVYEAAAMQVSGVGKRQDAHFVPVGGTGAIARVASILRSLTVPTCVIADLDFVLDANRVGAAAEALGTSRDRVNALKAACRALQQQLEQIGPTITESGVANELADLASIPRNWKRKDDRELVKALKRLLSRVDRTQRLKSGGIDAYRDHAEVVVALKKLCSLCAAEGIFLVECGEVEGWAPMGVFTDSELEAKTGVAEQVASFVRDGDPRVAPLIEFIKGVCGYLCASAASS